MKLSLRLLMLAVVGLANLQAQKAPTTSSPGVTTTPPGSTTGVGNPTPASPTTTTPAPNTTTPSNAAPRPVFLSGRVITDDGAPLPGNINIQSVCATQQHVVAHTSSSGDFSFLWANTASTVIGDASDGGRYGGGGSSNSSGTNSSSGQTGYGGTAVRIVNPMANCDLRAEVSGYTSSRASLYDRGGQDVFDVGAIVLHRLSGDEGRVVSMLALKAPKDAKKSFDKGTELARANKPADAATNFQKAVASYPQYADAWLGLGMAESELGAKDSAQGHFQKAMELDDKLTGPWQELGYLAAAQSRWEDAARFLAQAVRLDPTGSPKAWYLSGIANFNLGRFEQA